MAEKSLTVAEVKTGLIDGTWNNVQSMIKQSKLVIPSDYNVGNALQAAWLELMDTTNKSNVPAIKCCKMSTIQNCFLKMISAGLNPAKGQCYFVVYGNKLTLMVSQYGMEVMAKRSNPEIDYIISEVVYEGDVFQVGRRKGRKYIAEHSSNLKTMNTKKIVAAYCSVFFKNGDEETDIMTFEEIQDSWRHAKEGNRKNHAQHPVEFAKRTVTKRHCKKFVYATKDRSIIQSFEEEAADITEEETEKTISENANIEELGFEEPEEVFEAEFSEVEEKAEETEVQNCRCSAVPVFPEEQEAQAEEKGPEDSAAEMEAIEAAIAQEIDFPEEPSF